MKTSMVPDGIIPPLLTPLTEDQQVDVPALKLLIKKQLKAGIPALFVCGTAGLGSVLTLKQYEKVISTVLKTVPPGYPLLCGVLESSTIRDLERIQLLDSLKISCFVCIAPYYLRAMEKDALLRHFGALRESTSMEMVIYNIPSCTNMVIEPDLIIDMAKRGWSSIIKDSSGDHDYLKTLCERGGEIGLRVFQGLAPKFAWLNEIGASGCVPVPANCHPELFNSAWAARADQSRLPQIQSEVDSVWDKLVCSTDYISQSIKQLAEEGIGTGTLMLP